MEDVDTTRQLIRLVGTMAIVVALAWILQVLGLGGSDAFGRLAWVVAAAAIAGIGAGLIYGSASMRSFESSNKTRVR